MVLVNPTGVQTFNVDRTLIVENREIPDRLPFNICFKTSKTM